MEFSLDQLVEAAEWAWSSDAERQQKQLPKKANLPVLKAVLKRAGMPTNGKKADIITRITTSRLQIERNLGTSSDNDLFLLVCKCATRLRGGVCEGCTSCTCDKQGKFLNTTTHTNPSNSGTTCTYHCNTTATIVDTTSVTIANTIANTITNTNIDSSIQALLVLSLVVSFVASAVVSVVVSALVSMQMPVASSKAGVMRWGRLVVLVVVSIVVYAVVAIVVPVVVSTGSDSTIVTTMTLLLTLQLSVIKASNTTKSGSGSISSSQKWQYCHYWYCH